MDPTPVLGAVVLVAAGYLIGGIPWGIVVARVVGGPDPRSLGSGRTGGANVMRALGLRAALVAGLLDAAKGAVAVLLARWLGADPIVQVLAALAAIIGHSRSPYIGLRGGRGVAPAWGATLVIQPLIAVLIIPVFVGMLFATRISSVASLTCSLAGGIAILAAVATGWLEPAFAVYGVAGTATIWLFHVDNIQRLRAGEERRIEWGLRGRPGPQRQAEPPGGSTSGR
jgi:glycerol-3-phosphate acyltransferase PlsY